MSEYTFDACITVEAESAEAAANLILEHCLEADIALFLVKCGTLHKSPSGEKETDTDG